MVRKLFCLVFTGAVNDWELEKYMRYILVVMENSATY